MLGMGKQTKRISKACPWQLELLGILHIVLIGLICMRLMVTIEGGKMSITEIWKNTTSIFPSRDQMDLTVFRWYFTVVAKKA